MKLHINTETKTVAIEGKAKISTVFNYLLSWFPEEWEDWTFVQHEPTIQYKEIIVEKSVWRSPYWNPWNPTYVSMGGLRTITGSTSAVNQSSIKSFDGSSTSTVNPSFTNSTTTTLNFNNVQ